MHRGAGTMLALLVLFAISGSLPINGVAAQGATPAATPATGAQGDFSETVDIGGRALYLTCQGAGTPTIVIDHGQGGSSRDMASLQREFRRDSRVCLYDRAGQGRSNPLNTPLTAPRTAADVVADLHELLQAAGVPGPYVLIGQSAGGVFVELYARTYPEEVAGVVSANAVPPADPWLDQSAPFMTEQERADELAYYEGGDGAEDFDWNTSFAQLDAAAAPLDTPFLVLISTVAECESADDICGRTHGVYEAVMQGLAAQWPHGEFMTVDGGHEIYLSPKAIFAMRSFIEAFR